MNAKQLNAQALLNNIKGYINMLTNTKATMKAVVKDWNVCIEQSGADFLTFDFPVEGWTRKAVLIAEFERVAVQLNNILEGRDALQNTTEETPEMTNTITPVSFSTLPHNAVALAEYNDLSKGLIWKDGVAVTDGGDAYNCMNTGAEGDYLEPDAQCVFIGIAPTYEAFINMVNEYQEGITLSNFDRVLNIIVREGGVNADSMREHLESRSTQEPLADAACTLLIHACGVPITDELRAELVAAAR